MRRGFTLVEVIVALVVLEIGVVAVSGVMLLASRHLSEALARETAATVVQATLDSLALAGAASAWTRGLAVGELRGQRGEGGQTRVVVASTRGDTLADVHTWLPEPPGG